MIGPIVLAVIAAVFLAVYFLPVRLRGEYSEKGPRVDAVLGFWTISLFPREGEKKPKKKEKKKQNKKSKDKSKKSGGTLPLFRQLSGLLLEFLEKFWRTLHMDTLTLHLTVGGDKAQAADAALLYGKAWAAVGTLIPLMERVLVIHNRDVQIEIDYQQQEDTIYAYGEIRVFLGEVLGLAIVHGLRGLKIFILHKIRKGGK